MKINPETQFVEANGKLTQDGFNTIREALSGSSSSSGGSIGAGMVDGWSGNIKKVADGSLTLVQSTSFAGTITKTDTECEAGNATFTFNLNGVAFDGTANDVSTVKQSQVHTMAFVLDDKIELTMSANSGCEKAAFTIHYTRS